MEGSVTHALMVTLVLAGATFATRIAPFIAFRKAGADARLRYVGSYLPLMITLILVVYSFKDVAWDRPAEAVANAAGAATTLVTQIFARNALASIAAGVTVYALCLRLL